MHVSETELIKGKINLLGLVRRLQKDIYSLNYLWSLGDLLQSVPDPRDSPLAQKALNGLPKLTCPENGLLGHILGYINYG